MSLNYYRGQAVARIATGESKGEIIYLDRSAQRTAEGSGLELDLKNDKLVPLMSVDTRAVEFVAGCSGAGKSRYTAQLIKDWKKLNPDGRVYFFSCTSYKEDPAYNKIKMKQVTLDTRLLKADSKKGELDDAIIKALRPGSLIVFDDVGTIINPKIKGAVCQLIMQIMEIGRRMRLWLILTNHLLNPAEKLLGRTVMNEMSNFTCFPQSGSKKQIRYALDKYFEMDKHQINKVLSLPSRWVTLSKQSPLTVTHENGIYLA